MAMERIYVTEPRMILKAGHQGENLARCICFPLTSLAEQYGEGTWTIVFRRPFESDPYVVANQEEVGDYAVWGLDATDTAVCGEGRVELRYYVDDVLCKTDVYAVSLLPSLGTTGDAPSPYEDIIDAVAGYAAEARDAVASVPETVAELQAELDEAISGVTVDSEVINARVDEDGTTYSTLKQRLDAQHTDLKNALNYTNTKLEEHKNESAELIAPLYSGDVYTGNPVSIEINDASIITIESQGSGNILFCGKNMFDDSFYQSFHTESPHMFYGMGADFNDTEWYDFNNSGEGIIFSASMKADDNVSITMALYIKYTDDTTRRQNFSFSDASTWNRQRINIFREGKTVASLAIRCTSNTASHVYVKDIMVEKSLTLSEFVPFEGGILSSESAYSREGVNNFISSVADDVLTVTVLNNPLSQTNATKIADMESDLYAMAVTDSAIVEANRTVSSGTWGIIPSVSAEEMEITPQFDITTGTYTVTHYKLSGDDQTLTLVNSETHNIGETATLSNVSASDYYTISASDGNLKYRNDSSQTFVSKFAYISSGKAVDYANSQIAGSIVFKNRVPKADEKQFTGKTIVFFGDSRTWYDGKAYTSGTKPEWAGKICKGYQQTVIALTGCEAINKGFSGYTSAQICEQIKAYDFSLVDAVYLSGGVNDFIKQDEISTGEIQPIGGTFDTTTSYGAWQSTIEYLLTNYPQLKIYIDTPWVCWNWYGNILPESIAEVKKNVAELYSIECLDMYHISGLNVINRDYFFVDDLSGNGQSRLHMNDYGNEWLGNIIGKYILSY